MADLNLANWVLLLVLNSFAQAECRCVHWWKVGTPSTCCSVPQTASIPPGLRQNTSICFSITSCTNLSIFLDFIKFYLNICSEIDYQCSRCSSSSTKCLGPTLARWNQTFKLQTENVWEFSNFSWKGVLTFLTTRLSSFAWQRPSMPS